MTLPNGLLEDIKTFLGITWTDTATDKDITGIIARGMARINRIGGSDYDFTQEDRPRELLFEYCFYAHSKALSEFEEAYKSELLSLQMHQEIKDWMEANADGATNV